MQAVRDAALLLAVILVAQMVYVVFGFGSGVGSSGSGSNMFERIAVRILVTGAIGMKSAILASAHRGPRSDAVSWSTEMRPASNSSRTCRRGPGRIISWRPSTPTA